MGKESSPTRWKFGSQPAELLKFPCMQEVKQTQKTKKAIPDFSCGHIGPAMITVVQTKGLKARFQDIYSGRIGSTMTTMVQSVSFTLMNCNHVDSTVIELDLTRYLTIATARRTCTKANPKD